MTEQIDYDPNTVLEVLNNKADRDLNNVTDGTYQVLTTKNITNCITKIPQNIKLELNDDTLTLKAGSKVYVPNGVGVFDEVVVDVDKTFSPTNNSQDLLFIKANGNPSWYNINLCFSGNTQPTFSGNHAMWYDTGNNIIKETNNGGSSWTEGVSFPVAQVTDNGTIATSIDQVFNGFGYIGNTIFALPGVEGLIPNGRNADSSLNNIKWKADSVITFTHSNPFAGTFYFGVYDNKQALAEYECKVTYYDQAKNIVVDTYPDPDVDRYGWSLWGVLTKDSTGRITSFNPKTTFQVIDRNDKEEIISWGMPDLTAGVNLTSGTTIPVNSLVYVASTRSAGNLARAYLDGEEMFKNEGGASTSDGSGATFLAPENSIYTSSGNFDKQIYYPLKGEI